MIKAPVLEMRIELLMGNIEKVSELLGIVVAKQVGKGKHQDDLEGNWIAFSKLVLKVGEKPGKVLLPHGMPSDDG